MLAIAMTKKKIAENLKTIRDNIAAACQRADRDPAEVRIIAVTKYVELDAIRALLEIGLPDIGESRVQQFVQRHAMIDEFLSRCGELGRDEPAPIQPRWHMVGHLQRNKVKALLPVCDYVHSVDSLRLAEEVNTQAARLGLQEKVKVFLQVNASQEKSKFGLAVGAVSAMAEQLATLPNLELVGLMTMAPLTEESDVRRFCFGRLREIFEDLRAERIVGPSFRHLSMGMSADYIDAVEMGATMIRIGSALFAE